MINHIVQSPEWGKIKTEYGTKAVRVGDVQYTKHKIPFSEYFYAYCPKVNPYSIKFDVIKDSLVENSCIAINFDIPNVIKGSHDEKAVYEIFASNCERSPRDQFAKYNILLDISKDENQLLSLMHSKHRYNLKYALKKGVEVTPGSNQKDFEEFFELYKNTAERQKYYIHQKTYYQKIWEIFKPLDMAHILTARYNKIPLASWMFFNYQDVIYYPYGGSSEKYRNLNASTLVAWEGIKLGRKLGCNIFDMWGASKDLNDKNDAWWGFSNFKIRFGGTHVAYVDSYDYVLNKSFYALFNTANDIRWKILNLLK